MQVGQAEVAPSLWVDSAGPCARPRDRLQMRGCH
jgi:hypothetical protein